MEKKSDYLPKQYNSVLQVITSKEFKKFVGDYALMLKENSEKLNVFTSYNISREELDTVEFGEARSSVLVELFLKTV